MPAIKWSDILKVAVPAGAAVGGALIASHGAKSAADTQAKSATDALALQRDIFNREQSNLAPYLRAGNLSLTALLRGLGIGPNVTASPASLNPAGAPGGGNLSYSSPLLGQLKAKAPSALTTGATRTAAFAGAGATAGSVIPGVGTAIGAGVGAGVGAVSSLFGRGRREANDLVPLQNQVSGEVDRITKAVDQARQNGTLNQADLQTAINTVQGLQSEFGSVAQDFGRAGPGGVATLHQYFDPMVQQWQGELGNLPQSGGGNVTDMQPQADGSYAPAASGQDTAGQPMGFGDLNRSFDFSQDPRYNPQFEGLNHPFTMADYQSDPGTAFRQAEGQKGVERSGSAKGMTLSGAGVKAIDRYNQDYASNEFQNAYQRFANERNYGTGEYQRAFDRFNTEQGNQFNHLAAVAGIGQTANGQNASAGANFGANASNLITDAASAQSAAQLIGSNNVANALRFGGNTFSDMLRARQSGYQRPPSTTTQYPDNV